MGKKGKTGKGRLDKFYHLAKEQGYRSRAAFKLIQLNKKYNFLEHAKVLIDLCAAPGGWLQVASKYMPAQSIIVGVDLVPIKAIPRCTTFAEDITTDKCRAQLRGELKTWKADVVLHDGAPNVGTAWVQDAYSQAELVLHSLKLATEFLAKGGTFVTKVFRSKDYNALVWVFNQLFEDVEATKPPSSRNVSAEIFVVCRKFKAPKKIDPKFLDPRHVFEELEEQTTTSLTSVFQPDKKKRHRDGYEDGDYTLFHSLAASKFVHCNDPVAELSSNNEITFKEDEDRVVQKNQLTTDEICTLCSDLKVLGKKEFKALLKWRLALRTEMGLEKKKQQEVEKEEKEEELDDEERMARELEKLTKEEASRDKRTKRKLREKRAKEILRMQLNMTAPTDVGTDQVGEDVLFKANGNNKTLVEVTEMDLDHSGSEQEFEDGSDIEDMSDVGEQIVNAGIVLDDKSQKKLSGKAALFFSNPLFQAAMSDNENDDDDHLDRLNKELEEEVESRKRKREEKRSMRDSDDSSSESELDASDRIVPGADVDSDSDSDSDSEFGQPENDGDLSDVDLDATGPPKNGLMTPHALALAHMVVQNKSAVIDSSFNRYTYGDADDLPAWFVDDERKFNRPVMPVSKETVEAIMERRRALDARPIKKVAEAKYRKKKRAMAKVERIMKKAASIAEAEDMTESAKAQSISKLLSKKVASKPHEKPKLVVAKGANRALKGRPNGVKGRYKMVDPRMKKEVRATKRVAAASGGRKKRKTK